MAGKSQASTDGCFSFPIRFYNRIYTLEQVTQSLSLLCLIYKYKFYAANTGVRHYTECGGCSEKDRILIFKDRVPVGEFSDNGVVKAKHAVLSLKSDVPNLGCMKVGVRVLLSITTILLNFQSSRGLQLSWCFRAVSSQSAPILMALNGALRVALLLASWHFSGPESSGIEVQTPVRARVPSAGTVPKPSWVLVTARSVLTPQRPNFTSFFFFS